MNGMFSTNKIYRGAQVFQHFLWVATTTQPSVWNSRFLRDDVNVKPKKALLAWQWMGTEPVRRQTGRHIVLHKQNSGTLEQNAYTELTLTRHGWGDAKQARTHKLATKHCCHSDRNNGFERDTSLMASAWNSLSETHTGVNTANERRSPPTWVLCYSPFIIKDSRWL